MIVKIIFRFRNIFGLFVIFRYSCRNWFTLFFIMNFAFFIAQRAQPRGHALFLNSAFLIELIAEAAEGTASFLPLCYHETKHNFSVNRYCNIRKMCTFAVYENGQTTTLESKYKSLQFSVLQWNRGALSIQKI